MTRLCVQVTTTTGAKKMFETITIELREIFNNLSSVAVDALGEEHYPAIAEVFTGLANPSNLASKFENGDTVLLLGEKMTKLEECHGKSIPYIVVVTHKEKIFGVFNGERIDW